MGAVAARSVEADDSEYLTWQELQKLQADGRWELQLHSGEGHQQIQYGPGRYDAIFTQDRNARARPGDQPPFGRIQVNRGMAGGELYDMLLTGEQ
jgi:hypothetical protein